MPIKVNGATSGSVTLAAPATGTDVTLTLPGSSVDLAAIPQANVAGLTSDLAAKAATTSVGLNYITTASLSGTQTNINGCFSASYFSYRVVISAYLANNPAALTMKLRTASGDNTTADFRNNGVYSAFNSTASSFGNTGQLYVCSLAGDADIIRISMDIHGPQSSALTSFVGQWVRGTEAGALQGRNDGGTQFTGFSLASSSGNLSGDIWVWGYK